MLAWLMAHGLESVLALQGLLAALIGVCLLIPGDQPEKALQAALDFLSKFSKK